MYHTRFSKPVSTLLAFAFTFAGMSAITSPARADAPECRKKAARIVGKFAQLRAKQIINCRINDACGPDDLAAKREKLRNDLRTRLNKKCADVGAGELGMGGTCPDPTGVCTHDLADAAGVIECILCMSGETLEHLLDVVHGDAVPVAEHCGGCIGSRCAPDAFCEPPTGICDDVFDVGMCSEVPEACPQVFDPVCGCDGRTYGNDCERRMARVGLRHDGACKLRCDDADICPDGTFCDGLPGLCRIVNDGVCEPIPANCTEQYEPVCGCDGTTYGNDCRRRAAGVRLHHHGACVTYCGELFPFDPTQPGPDGQPILPPIEQCAEGSYCEHPPGRCTELGGPGECIRIPQGCPDVWAPVCGCNGITYANDCDRMAAGVSKQHDGECERRCGGFVGLPCAGGEVCELPAGTCNFADLLGKCVQRPEVCAENLDPVCGCDGETYSNNCERLRVRVALDHHGACRSNCKTAGLGCGAHEVCITQHGDCGGTGKCVPAPEICPLGIEVDAPFPFFAVCGCDGVTYPNACEAARAGVGVEHEGPCHGEFGCLSDSDCPVGNVCLPPPGICLLVASPVIPLVCQPIPDDCTDAQEPVCGCNGTTYNSHCEALRSGAGFGYPGPCFDFVPPLF